MPLAHPEPLLTPPLSPQTSPSETLADDETISSQISTAVYSTDHPLPVSNAAATPNNKLPYQLHNRPNLPSASHASGMYIALADDRILLDGTGGAAVAAIGMGNPEVIQAITQQHQTLGYAYHQLLGNPAGEELAKWLIERSDGAFGAAAFLTSGSEAVEGCVRTARQYWVEKGQADRRFVISRWPSYHGNTLGTLAVSVFRFSSVYPSCVSF